MSDEIIKRMAMALRDRAKKFSAPVHLYVEGEVMWLWQEANPDKDPWDAFPERDWELESWILLVRAALAAAWEHTPAMMAAWDKVGIDQDPRDYWHAGVDAALEEK